MERQKTTPPEEELTERLVWPRAEARGQKISYENSEWLGKQSASGVHSTSMMINLICFVRSYLS